MRRLADRWPGLAHHAPQLVVGALCAVLAVAVVLRGGDGPGPLGIGTYTATYADPTPLDGRSPREPAGAQVRVVVSLSRPALGERPDAADMSRGARRAYVGSLHEEGRSLRSALEARDIEMREVVEFARVLNGFAATVQSRDLPALASPGVRPEPVRRFYPALSEPLPADDVDGATVQRDQDRGQRGVVAVLAGGTDLEHPDLRGHLVRGFDAIEGDRDPGPAPDPRDAERLESSGTALAGVVAAAGARVRPVRVSAPRTGLEGADEHATTDTVIAGLEHAVDPDGDGDTSDAAAAALVAVNAPYAGFADSPEASAVAAATRLGMPVVAPAGGEGSGRAGAGTIGSPASARQAVAVAARAAPEAVPRVAIVSDGLELPGAAVLAGAELPTEAMPWERVEITDPAAFLRDPPVLLNRIAVVEAGDVPATQAAAAASAGAALVVLADPDERPLTAIPAGRVSVPVVGVGAAAAEALLDADTSAPLEVTPEPAAPAAPADAETIAPAEGAVAPASSAGPTLDGLGKPTFVAPGAAVAPVPEGASAILGGTAIAAARVAANIATGDGPAGEGAEATDPPEPGPAPDPVPVGEPELIREDGEVTGVRFTLGGFERGDPFGDGTLVRAASRLDLELVAPEGDVLRRLTPPGGARGLLPGVYEYMLPEDTREELAPARTAFRATARTPRRDDRVRRLSHFFRLRE